jgi:hypothetical protein
MLPNLTLEPNPTSEPNLYLKRRRCSIFLSPVLQLSIVGVLIGCFALYLIGCDNFRCPILIDRHKGIDLHQLLIEVILVQLILQNLN